MGSHRQTGAVNVRNGPSVRWPDINGSVRLACNGGAKPINNSTNFVTGLRNTPQPNSSQPMQNGGPATGPYSRHSAQNIEGPPFKRQKVWENNRPAPAQQFVSFDTRHGRQKVSLDEAKWMYLNDHANMSGPYTLKQLAEGFQSGFLKADLPVHQVREGTLDEAISLKLLVESLQSCNSPVHKAGGLFNGFPPKQILRKEGPSLLRCNAPMKKVGGLSNGFPPNEMCVRKEGPCLPSCDTPMQEAGGLSNGFPPKEMCVRQESPCLPSCNTPMHKGGGLSNDFPPRGICVTKEVPCQQGSYHSVSSSRFPNKEISLKFCETRVQEGTGAGAAASPSNSTRYQQQLLPIAQPPTVTSYSSAVKAQVCICVYAPLPATDWM